MTFFVVNGRYSISTPRMIRAVFSDPIIFLNSFYGGLLGRVALALDQNSLI